MIGPIAGRIFDSLSMSYHGWHLEAVFLLSRKGDVQRGLQLRSRADLAKSFGHGIVAQNVLHWNRRRELAGFDHLCDDSFDRRRRDTAIDRQRPALDSIRRSDDGHDAALVCVMGVGFSESRFE